jgi:pyruvate formate lyase activating enzyme
LHNWGCTFSCPFCSYKLRSGENGRPGFAEPKPSKFLSIEEQNECLLELKPEKVFFMGGEPTVAKELPEMVKFCKETLKAQTKLGHTNGSNLDIPFLDGANIGFKAWSEELHLKITGRPKSLIYDNFTLAFNKGLTLAANMVFIPKLVDLDQLDGLCDYLSKLSRDIPFHIMGYIPVPGLPYLRPTNKEMDEAIKLASSYLKDVKASHLTTQEALDLTARDDRFDVKIVAGV